MQIIYSCNNNNDTNYTTPTFPIHYKADLHILNDQVMYSFYYQPLLSDSLLIIPDVNQDTMINIYHKSNGKLLKKIGIKGRGAGELLTPTKFSLDHQACYLFINDYGKNSILKYDLHKIMQDSSLAYNEYKLTHTLNGKNKIGYLKDSLFYTSDNKHKIQIATLNQDIETNNDIFPLSGLTNKLSNSFLNEWSLNTVSPNGTQYVSVTTLGGIMEIYNLTPHINLHKRLFFIEPLFNIDKYRIKPAPDAIYGFSCLYASNNYIYATIFAERNPQHYPNKIWQFDWNGNPIAEIECPSEIGSFTVDEENHKIFAIILNSEHEEALASLDIAPSISQKNK